MSFQMTQYYCNLCGEEEIINTRKGVIYRHILGQHSGYGYKCQGCKQIFSRERPRHQGCQYPDGQNVLLVNRLIGGWRTRNLRILLMTKLQLSLSPTNLGQQRPVRRREVPVSQGVTVHSRRLGRCP